MSRTTTRRSFLKRSIALAALPHIVEGIPGTATGMDYSAWRFEEGDLVIPDEPGFGLRLSL